MTKTNYSSKPRPRRKTDQLGNSGAFTSYHRPLLERLEVYENVYKYDPLVHQVINLIIDTLIGSMGDIEHPDQEIQEFCRYAAGRLEDEHNINLPIKIKEIIEVAMWAGFSVSENVFEVYEGDLLLRDIVTYHPSSIIIRTDKRGRLVDNYPSFEGDYYKSGIYQTHTLKEREVKIPLWKLIHIAHDKKFNNHYGTSAIEAIYRWHVLQEAFVDMMTVTLDRYGNPLTVFTVPRVSSGITEVDPITNEERTLTTKHLLERQLEGEFTSLDNNNLILEYFDKDLKPEAKVLTTANNLSEAFQSAIDYCEKQKIRNLLVPYGLLEPTNMQDLFGERQMEMFNRVISSVYHQFVVPILSQSFHRLIKFNYGEERGKIPPRLPLRKAARPEARVALMQMIKGLTEMGYFNPTEPVDWAMVREMVDALDRPMGASDKKFIKDLLIAPRQPKESKDKKDKEGKEDNEKSSTTSTIEPPEDRSLEGKIRGKGAPGRSSGVVSPHQKARLKKD